MGAAALVIAVVVVVARLDPLAIPLALLLDAVPPVRLATLQQPDAPTPLSFPAQALTSAAPLARLALSIPQEMLNAMEPPPQQTIPQLPVIHLLMLLLPSLPPSQEQLTRLPRLTLLPLLTLLLPLPTRRELVLTLEPLAAPLPALLVPLL
jgi:hypothetical protein